MAQTDPPKFEVTSVKPWVSGAGFHPFECAGNHFHSVGMIFGNLLQWAYELRLQGSSQRKDFLERAPEPLRLAAYDIEAVATHPFASEAECRLMVQTLLADRFKLAFHWEEREGDIAHLVVAPGGFKLQKALASDNGSDVNIVVNGKTTLASAPLNDPEVREQTKGLSMEELAIYLPSTGMAPVANKTGLEGRYKIDLQYSTSLPVERPEAATDPILEIALAKLGLRLEKSKGTVNVRVLDHIEAPARISE